MSDLTEDSPRDDPHPEAPPRRSVGTWVAVGLVLIVIVFGAVFASRFGHVPDLVGSPLIGQPAPDITLPLLETTGYVFHLSSCGKSPTTITPSQSFHFIYYQLQSVWIDSIYMIFDVI